MWVARPPPHPIERSHALSLATKPKCTARPARLSPSALDRYRTCPRRFAYQDLDRREFDRGASPALVLGNAVHHALERFFGLPPADRSEQQLHTALRSVWKQHAKPGVFTSREAEAECGRTALAMLRTFCKRFDTAARPAAREQWVAKRLSNGVKVFGKVDRIDLAPDGTLHVIDYKTGRHVLDEGDLSTESAVQVYATATEAAARRTVSRLRVIYLAHGIEVRWEPEREDLDTAEERLTELTDAILADREFNATPGPHCDWCPFRMVCEDSGRVSASELTIPDDIMF